MKYIGIDPGQSAGWASITIRDGCMDEWFTRVVLSDVLPIMPLCDLCAVEGQWINMDTSTPAKARESRAKAQGAISVAHNAGMWMHAADVAEVPYIVADPNTWRAALGMRGANRKALKQAAMDFAARVTGGPWRATDHEAEALALAYYAWAMHARNKR